MTTYRDSNLAPEAPGHAEIITQHDGDTMNRRGANGRIPAFMGLAQRTGGVFYENPPSMEEALRQTGLDFEVTLEDLMTTVPAMNADNEPEIRVEHLPRHRATVGRYPDGRTVPFGPVGNRYTPIQNTAVANLGQLIVDGDVGKLVAVGAFGEPVGARVYMAFDLGDFLVGGSDRHNLALTLMTSHDGSSGLTAGAAPVRVQCTNQVSGIFGRSMASRFTIRHTESADGKAQEVREALGLTWKYVDRYKAEAEGLLGRDMNEHDFLAWEHELFQVPAFEDASQRQRTMVGNRDEALIEVLRSDTNEFGRNTRFAAAQSVYEYLDHMSIIRGSDPEAARWERILSGQTEAQKGLVWASLVRA